jgi:hypothetical protein
MRQRIRSHLTYANVMATLAVFLVLGGTAMAATGYIISSNDQVGPDTISGHRSVGGSHPNIISQSINGRDVAPFSGIEECTPGLVAPKGRICAGSNGSQKTWQDADQYCADLGLRLPSLSEAVTMARKYDVPGISDSAGQLWTDELIFGDPLNRGGADYWAFTVDEGGDTRLARVGIQVVHPGDFNHGPLMNVVCVADPTNIANPTN